jgi:hypothetical protein
MKNLSDTLSAAVDRAANSVGVITLLLAIGAFGIAFPFVGPANALGPALAVFGLIGALEVLQRNLHAQREQQRDLVRQFERIFEQSFAAHPDWHPKRFKSLRYRGVCFNAVGFEELPLPLAIAGPLCPRCQAKLAATQLHPFPFLHRVELRCQDACGFALATPYGPYELLFQVHQMANSIKIDAE